MVVVVAYVVPWNRKVESGTKAGVQKLLIVTSRFPRFIFFELSQVAPITVSKRRKARKRDLGQLHANIWLPAISWLTDAKRRKEASMCKYKVQIKWYNGGGVSQQPLSS